MRLSIIVIPFMTFAVASVGGAITEANMDWYDAIAVPSWTPAGGVIGIVWTVLFVLATIAAIQAWNLAPSKRRTTILVVFVLNAILNVLWSTLFFGLHEMQLAFYEAIALGLSVLTLIVLLWNKKRSAALLLIPYAAWVAFASLLTYSVWMLNL